MTAHLYQFQGASAQDLIRYNESVPLVKGNNRFGAKGTIRCLACQHRKGKCEFPADKPHLPCEHCKRRGLKCGDKLPTERKREEMRLRKTLGSPSLIMTSPLWAPPAPNYPPPHYFRPYDGPRQVIHVLFPRGSDLVRSIENQIPTASSDEIFSIAQFLAEKGLVGNPSIAGFTVSRGHLKYSFQTEWHETINIHRQRRSFHLHYDPGQRMCRPGRADDVSLHTHPHKAIATEDTSPALEYSAIDVGNLFDEAAAIHAMSHGLTHEKRTECSSEIDGPNSTIQGTINFPQPTADLMANKIDGPENLPRLEHCGDMPLDGAVVDRKIIGEGFEIRHHASKGAKRTLDQTENDWPVTVITKYRRMDGFCGRQLNNGTSSRFDMQRFVS